MSKKDNDQTNQTPGSETTEEPEILLDEVNKAKEKTSTQEEKSPNVEEAVQAAVKEQEDKYLRLLAEYDNYRKRSQKEKENAWTTAKAETAKEFLPVYDNLERAMKQATADEAYAKGVEMTMTQLKAVLEKLGLEEIQALGQPFDPQVHNAVMHVEDEALGENTVAEVFQTGWKLGDKVIRFAMVKVAN
jgi:molecular chaperone GrpE